MDKEPKAIRLAARTETAPPEGTTEKTEITVKHQPRTKGEWMVDTLIYPVIMNFGVFAISVGATYLTNKGGIKNANGEYIHGKIGKWFFDRGEHLKGFFKKNGLNEEQADMSKMVFFSFLDGSLLAPVVKLLEDRREKIARFFDKQMGTTPADDSAYREEPKQTWGSVLGGRLITAPIVVTTATILEKAGLNKRMFHDPGMKLGKFIESKPNIAKYFKGLDLPELGKVGVFEAVYTTICTAGVYLTSRFLAKKNAPEKQTIITKTAPAAPADEHTESTPKTFANDGLKKKPIAHEMPAGNFAERAAETPQLAMQI